MRLIFFDTETSGLDRKKDHAIQLGAIIVDERFRVLKTINEYFYTDCLISDGAIRVHGIDKLKLNSLSGGLYPEDKAHVFPEFFSKGNIFVGHNIDFDLCMLNNSLRHYTKTIDKPTPINSINFEKLDPNKNYSFCTMKNLSSALGFSRYQNLEFLFRRYCGTEIVNNIKSSFEQFCQSNNMGINSSQAHDALYDIYMTIHLTLACKGMIFK